jgi:hypothetical protein
MKTIATARKQIAFARAIGFRTAFALTTPSVAKGSAVSHPEDLSNQVTPLESSVPLTTGRNSKPKELSK